MPCRFSVSGALRFRPALWLVMTAALLLFRSHAAPYNGNTCARHQPDGETITVRLLGGEYLACQETEDGFLIMRDDRTGGFPWCMGCLSAGPSCNMGPDADSFHGVKSAMPPMAPGSPVGIEAVCVRYPYFMPVPDGFKKPTFFRVGVSMPQSDRSVSMRSNQTHYL